MFRNRFVFPTDPDPGGQIKSDRDPDQALLSQNYTKFIPRSGSRFHTWRKIVNFCQKVHRNMNAILRKTLKFGSDPVWSILRHDQTRTSPDPG